MRIRVLKLGKPAVREYASLVDRYVTRLAGAYRLENSVIKNAETQDLRHRLDLDAGRGNRLLVSFDERGKSIDTLGLADFLQMQLADGRIKQLDFLIGGPYGLSPEIRQTSDRVWKLSEMVIPSDLAWLMVWEQLYRAHAILSGSKYHHE